MTPLNLVKHLDNPNMPFWRMLKEGDDHFEVTRLEPKVEVCEKRYVFDAELAGGLANDQIRNETVPWRSNPLTAATTAVTPSFNPIGWCPAYKIPREIALAVAEKNRRDESQMAELLSRSTSAVPLRAGSDIGFGWHRR
jgi:murein L,D-transpeptidase YafK